MLKKLHSLHNQVIKIQRVCPRQLLLIARVDLCRHRPEIVRRVFCLHVRRRHELILRSANQIQHTLRRKFLVVEVQVLHAADNQLFLIIRVIDGKAGLVAEQPDMAAKNAYADRVESSRPHSVRRRRVVERLCKALFDFARRLVGEGDRQHCPRRADPHGKTRKIIAERRTFACCCRAAGIGKVVRHLARLGDRLAGKPVAQNVDNALHQHSRLAAPRARKDKQRSLHRADRLALHVIQFAVIRIKKRLFLRVICRWLQYQFHRPGRATALSKLK